MASRAQYMLKIGGRLRGDKAGLKAFAPLKTRLTKIFAPIGAGTGAFGDKPGDGWPKGFILKNYSVCQWDLSLDRPHRPEHPKDKKAYRKYSEEVMVTFRAEVHHNRQGSLFLNRLYMLPDVNWFYHYRKYLWHTQLTEKLNQLNRDFQKDLIERIWFRDWQWYCGNGGC